MTLQNKTYMTILYFTYLNDEPKIHIFLGLKCASVVGGPHSSFLTIPKKKCVDIFSLCKRNNFKEVVLPP